VKLLLLVSLPFGVVTTTGPVVAPEGTVAVISVLDTKVNAAAAPLNVTLDAPVIFVPRIITDDAAAPEAVTVSTNAPSPTDNLKAVP
jgi:hypothetical protein